MKLIIKKGSTSVTLYLFIQDSSSTTGNGKTGLAYNTASLSAYYVRPLGSATSITLATQTVTGAWSSGGFVEVDSTNMPGWYRFDIPDAVIASGVNSAGVHFKGASGMAPLPLEVQLVAYDPQDSVRLGLTALPNATAGATNGLPLSVDSSGRVDVLKVNGTSQTARDLGASVLLSSGTGTGQVSLSSGAVTVGTNNDKTGYGLSAAAVQSIWDALTSALTTVGSIGKLLVDNINATISSRSTYAGGDTSGTTTLLSRLTSTRAGNLDNLDAAVSTRSTYAGADTSGTTTLLSRIASALTITGGKVDVNDKTGFALTSAYDPAKTAAQAGDAMALTSGERTTLAASIWSALTSGLTTVGSIGKRIVDYLTGDIYARIGAPAGASVSADIAAVKSDTGAIKAKTDNLPATPSATGDAMTLTSAYDAAKTAADATTVANAQSTILLTVDSVGTLATAIKAKTDNLPSSPAEVGSAMTLTSAYDPAKNAAQQDWVEAEAAYTHETLDAIRGQTDRLPSSPSAVSDIPTTAAVADKVLGRNLGGGSDGGRTVQDALRQLRNKVTLTPIDGTTGTLTVYAEDDTTIAWSGPVTFDATAKPITGVDPS